MIKKRILIIDDDANLSSSLKDFLTTDEIEVFSVTTGKEGISLCSSEKMDIILLDQKLPDGDGSVLCPEIIKYNDNSRIIFITAFPSFENALQAIKFGAHDYLSKPFEPDELKLAVSRQLEMLNLNKLKRVQKKKSSDEKNENILIGNFGRDSGIHRMIDIAASSDKPVLITGETGTGKNIVAKTIHFRGKEKSAPFFTLNCAAIPESLIEAELFGSEKGAFTGAEARRAGVFEISDGGTLLLDEIGSMPFHLQAKLLGVLDEGKLKRLGGEVMIDVNTRVIAATNSDLDEMISSGEFRQDLYFRLGVILINIPPLRERVEDIPDLVDHFLKVTAPGKNFYISDEEIEKLKKYRWPGNIRELRNIIDRSVMLFKGELFPSKLLFGKDRDFNHIYNNNIGPDKKETYSLKDIETEHIKNVLKKNNNNLAKSSRDLDISISTMKRKVKQIKMD
ncbi:MAG: sigma-54 dependent transcriptional regulator [Acidobacteriota bacterium]